MAWTETRDLDQICQKLQIDPHWFIYNFDLLQDNCQLLLVNETVYESSSFMDQRLNAGKPESVNLKLSSLLQKCAADCDDMRPVNYLFHIGHCGSTLISRLLGSQSAVLALREPLLLVSLAFVNRQLETEHSPINAATYSRLEKFIVRLLSRTFADTQRALVKPTSTCCKIAQGLMDYHPDSRAILLYMDLESYLTTMLRADENRTAADHMTRAIFADYHELGGTADLDLDTLSVGEKIAFNWIVQMAWLTRLNLHQPQNTLMVDFDDFLSAPADMLQKICALLGVDSTSDALRASVEGPLMHSYAKVPEFKYDKNTRREVMQESRLAHEDEISSALAWAERLRTSLPDAGCLARYLTGG